MDTSDRPLVLQTPPRSPPVGGLWTVRDFAAFVNTTEEGARAMLKRGQVPSDAVVRIGRRRVRIVPERIRQWLGLDS